ncbi:MAG TPA: RNA polymerase sigma-70 factor [Gemmatimonadaceae bacterium]
MTVPLSPPSGHDDLERYRTRLFGIAYRMLGQVQDAEDLVQETFLRWQQRSPTEDIREPEAWLVTVLTRLAIDRLRHAAAERAVYIGPWLPEPIASDRLAPDREVEVASDLSLAFLVLLERLGPEERAAFLLREVFDSGYDEIARTLERSEAAARQVVHRARERVREARARFPVPPDAKERLLRSFLRAIEADDKEAMLAVLAPEATFTSDGGGKVRAARRPVRGAERIARMLSGIERKFHWPFRYRLGHVNGEPALIQFRGDALFAVSCIDTDGERIRAVYRVMNPDKLRYAR